MIELVSLPLPLSSLGLGPEGHLILKKRMSLPCKPEVQSTNFLGASHMKTTVLSGSDGVLKQTGPRFTANTGRSCTVLRDEC